MSSGPFDEELSVFDVDVLLKLLKCDVLVSADMCDIEESGKLSAGIDSRLAGESRFLNFIPVGISRSFQSWKSLGTFVGSVVLLVLSSSGVMFSPINNRTLSGSNLRISEWWYFLQLFPFDWTKGRPPKSGANMNLAC